MVNDEMMSRKRRETADPLYSRVENQEPANKQRYSLQNVEYSSSSHQDFIETASKREVEEYLQNCEKAIVGAQGRISEMVQFNEIFDFFTSLRDPVKVNELRAKRADRIKEMTKVAREQIVLLQTNENVIERSRNSITTTKAKLAKEQDLKRTIFLELLQENNMTTVALPGENKNTPRNEPDFFPPMETPVEQMKKQYEEMKKAGGFEIPPIREIRHFKKPEMEQIGWTELTPSLSKAIDQCDHYKQRLARIKATKFHFAGYERVRAAYANRSMISIHDVTDLLTEAFEEEERQEELIQGLRDDIEIQFLRLDKQETLMKKLYLEDRKLQAEFDEEAKLLEGNHKRYSRAHRLNEFACPICYSNFTNGVNSMRCPLIYQCGHTICSECTETGDRIAEEQGQPLACAVCRQDQVGVMIPNFAVMPQDPQNDE